VLEVNDFNAIRISLASPEQIKGWSYGEVTKPETINYRTLKPERDGLFDERIFGPSKDWECYCGKYKRVRYKGIICDKCGVEVARAKVRRERMGHIELASPAAHIWYVKGTPSRLGLLLDVSPRNLERVLYFATYIVIDVDNEGRNALLSQLRSEAEQALGSTEEYARTQVSGLQGDEAHSEDQRTELRAFEDDFNTRAATINAEAKTLRSTINSLIGENTEEEIVFESLNNAVIVKAGEQVTNEALIKISELSKQGTDLLEADTRKAIAAKRDVQNYSRDEEAKGILARANAQVEEIRSEVARKIEDLESIEPLQLLSEQKYRELHEQFGGVFRAGMGAEALREVVVRCDVAALTAQLRDEAMTASGQRKKKAVKRLKVSTSFLKSGNKPEWMFFTALPVIPPELRPMVQLDGGRFATSDLNDLYRRVINRNNRLKRLLELGAPEIIIRNEKRMLQEAVDALIDNGRRGRVVSGSGKHRLKSLSDMLKGKQGRFRQNLLGKRVDYSGRSVIVVGPELKLHQCGLPKKMALELFKPFVMRRLVERGFAHNIKSAKRIVERVRPEVWDVLEEVIKDYLVLLNRAPSLHRLSIQAFEAVLIEGSAIQIHPMVCSAFNADFDGDQMAVHVPLSAAAQREAREQMLAVHNMLSPANGEPMVSPSQEIVLGCYYMTVQRPGVKGEGKMFANRQESITAYQAGVIDLQAMITVRMPEKGVQIGLDGYRLEDGKEPKMIRMETTVGRVLFNDTLPPQISYRNERMDKGTLRKVMAECHHVLGSIKSAAVADAIKRVGFTFATRSGSTFSVADVTVPEQKPAMLRAADKEVDEVDRQFSRGLLTDEERYTSIVEIWTRTTEEMTEEMGKILDPYGLVATLANSGATKARLKQIRQLAAMRGLMADPSGRIIALPIRSNFREGLTVLEYFVSTHGGRKGLADTALRTADAGYLTRRLVDVAQDVVITSEDCGTTQGIHFYEHELREKGTGKFIGGDRILGRFLMDPLADPRTGEIIVGNTLDDEINDQVIKKIADAGITSLHLRSPLFCDVRFGICQMCFGRSLAEGKLVKLGEAVGIIAAQSIGEPGTQLTLRTFHSGGVASGEDITQGLPRVEELFEARVPKGQAILSEIDGFVDYTEDDNGGRKLSVTNSEVYSEEHDLPQYADLSVKNDDKVVAGATLAVNRETGELITAGMDGSIRISEDGDKLTIRNEQVEKREHTIPHSALIEVKRGDHVTAGYSLTKGPKSPQEILHIQGREAVQKYLVEEAQKVYRTQGVNVHDKHIEVIVRQMLRKVRVESTGDTELLQGDIKDRFYFEEANARILAEGGEPATATPILLGITKASLNTDSFLSAASFQNTTWVLTEAAVTGSVDYLRGLKENVIIGKLIPAGSGLQARMEKLRQVQLVALGQDIDQYLDGDTAAVAEATTDELQAAALQEAGGEFIVGENDGAERLAEMVSLRANLLEGAENNAANFDAGSLTEEEEEPLAAVG